jgi:pyruvate dehydrogenase E2 component (dihydrolipoamide acetyltransferase)
MRSPASEMRAPTGPTRTLAPVPQEPIPEAPMQQGGKPHATPSVRKLARELGVELSHVPGTGPHQRIMREDLQRYVKHAMSVAGTPSVGGIALPEQPTVDFTQFGETALQALTKIQKVSGRNLHRSWVTIPHVTQFDEADITELDEFRKSQKAEAERRGTKLTFLPFVVKAVTRALAEFPHFNASLDHTGESLIVKKYLHIGVAVDTENGLLVPVIRDADQKGLFELATELEELSERARSRRMRPADLQGGSFSISSLGGIGGTFFTPIVNHPEVAILGVSRMERHPVWKDDAFVPRMILPLSLSYDPRVIDGADAVRFTGRLTQLLGDLRLLLL